MRKFFWKASAIFVFLLIGSWFLFNNSNNSVKAGGGGNCYWTASSSLDMSDPNNWDNGSGSACTPAATNALWFGDTSVVASTTANATNNGDLEAYKIFVKSDYTGTISFNSGTVTSSNGLDIESGTVELSGGKLVLSSGLNITGGIFNSVGGNLVFYGDVGASISGGVQSFYNIIVDNDATFGLYSSTVTTSNSFVNNGILNVGDTELVILGNYTNNGTTTLGAGHIKKEATGGMDNTSYNTYASSTPVEIYITDKVANLIGTVTETITATLTAEGEFTDTNVITLTETGNNTGIFYATSTFNFITSPTGLNDDVFLDVSTSTTGTIALVYANYYGALAGTGISASFNYTSTDYTALAFDEISATVSSTGITNNLDTITSANVASSSGIYFEKPGYGRITFTAALDFSATSTREFLESIGTKLDMTTLGSVDFDARESSLLQAAGARIDMYGIDALGLAANSSTIYTKLTVRDDNGNVTTTGNIVSAPIYSADNNGTFTFTAGHFTKFDIDTTAPVITKNGGNVKIYEGTTYVDAGATATDTIDGVIDVSVTGAVDTSTPAVYTLTYTATDTASNVATTTRTVTVLEVTSTAQVISTSTEVSATTTTVVIGDNNTETSTISVPESVTDAITLDFSGLTASNTLPSEITANVSTSVGLVQVVFQDGTVIAGSGWDKTLTLPIIKSSTSATISTTGKTNTTKTVIELGDSTTDLTFDKAVKIVISGQVSGVLVAFKNNAGTSTAIPVCTAGQLADPETLTSLTGSCYSQTGSVVTIWTKHFTDFFTYTQTTNPSTGGGGGGSTITVPTVGTNPVLINNGAVKTNSRSVSLTFDVANASTVAISESSNFYGATWETYVSPKTFTLSTGNGNKTIYVKFRSSNGGMTNAYSVSINLDSGAITSGPGCPTLVSGDMIKVTGKPAIYALDNNLNYRYFVDGDVFKSWNADETYSKYYKSISQACFNSLNQPSSAPYHVFYRPGSEVVKYLSSDTLYVVGLNNTLYPITTNVAKAIFGTKYKVRTIGLSEWPYYNKATSTISEVTVYPGMLIKVDGKTYFVDENKVLREVTTVGMTLNNFKAAYVRSFALSVIAPFSKGEAITNKVPAYTSRLGQ